MSDLLTALAILLVLALAIAWAVRDRRAQTTWQPLRQREAETEPLSHPGDDATVWRTAGAHRALPGVQPAMPLSPLLHHADRRWWQRSQPDVHEGATEDWQPIAEYTTAGQSPDAAAMVAPVALRTPATQDALSVFRRNMARNLSRFMDRHPDPDQVRRVAQPTQDWDGRELRERLAREETGR